MRHIVKTVAAGFIAAAMWNTAPALAEVETKTPIKILMINSSDGDFIAAVYGEVLKEAGYRVKYVPGDYVAGYSAVATGDIDVSLAAWQTTGVELTKAALETGKVEDYGPTGVKVTEGWWYSANLKAACPGLPNWEALKAPACAAALATAETAPKGRYLDAPADWGTLSDQAIKELGLDLTLVNSGSAAALTASVKGALDRNEPILAWGYVPHWLYNDRVGGFVERPGFIPNVDVLKLGNKKTLETAKIAAQILKAYSVPAEAVAIAMNDMDNNGVKPEDAARAWMAANESTWRAWIPQ
jgi:glycine betaine/proline transport system substrate-binding protein